MKIFEVNINEAPVDSSWIKDMSWSENGAILVTVKDATYFIKIPKELYDEWEASDSKGEFFHKFIKNTYEVIKA